MHKNKYRFHILGLAHTVTNSEYTACAYTQKVLKFGKMMKDLGHTIIHYGHEDSQLECDEHVTVITNKDLEIAYGNYDWRNNFFKFDMEDHAYRTFDTNTIREIEKRKQPNDFLLPFWGMGHYKICVAHKDMIVVEPGIGYATGQFARWRIFESHAIRAAVNGAISVAETGKEDWYHAVIPNYFDPNEFEYSEEKDDYFLYLGRVYRGKGADIAYQVCQALGEKLIFAGQGSIEDIHRREDNNEPVYRPIPGQIEHVGYANSEKRKKLMSRAKGFFLPSMFCEPFGGAAHEALFSGCPIITTDWGVWPESNIHGYTGYRCRTMDHFLWAAKNISNIKPVNCRNWAINNFSLEKVGAMYEEYFRMVYDCYTGNGFYQLHPDRENLDWLKRSYDFE
jgi:glycosyltransferase involved in cell wall biosynthesis